MKKILIPLLLIVVLTGGILAWQKFSAPVTPIAQPEPITQEPEPVVPLPPEPEPVQNTFKIITLESATPGKELTDLVGSANVPIVLAINRLDDKNLRQGMTLVIPTSYDDMDQWEFMPANIETARTIPKLIIISQRVQAFGAYEFGTLVRSGPVSSGKKSTPTPSRLYFTNWKGKEVVSTFSDEWILKWNFNLDNFEGVAMHQYALPGYPASHSCVRFYAADAEWNYNWADQWIVTPDGSTKLASGTPVIIYGSYNFTAPAPWKQLPENPDATKISREELESLVTENLSTIEHEAAIRTEVMANQ